MIWNSFPTVDNQVFDVSIGGGSGATALNRPQGLLVTPSGELYVADYTNNRVLYYSSIPTSNGAAASLVYGQSNFVNTAANQGNPQPSATSMNNLGAVALSSSQQWIAIADQGNHRVLLFNKSNSSNLAAVHVLGQLALIKDG